MNSILKNIEHITNMLPSTSTTGKGNLVFSYDESISTYDAVFTVCGKFIAPTNGIYTIQVKNISSYEGALYYLTNIPPSTNGNVLGFDCGKIYMTTPIGSSISKNYNYGYQVGNIPANKTSSYYTYFKKDDPIILGLFFSGTSWKTPLICSDIKVMCQNTI